MVAHQPHAPAVTYCKRYAVSFRLFTVLETRGLDIRIHNCAKIGNHYSSGRSELVRAGEFFRLASNMSNRFIARLLRVPQVAAPA
jgi:hypothetical protein